MQTYIEAELQEECLVKGLSGCNSGFTESNLRKLAKRIGRTFEDLAIDLLALKQQAVIEFGK